MANKASVAWVGTDYEGCGIVVFHHHGLAARRLAAEAKGEDFDSIELRRAPEFDQYANQGYVPQMDLIRAGWWFECAHCAARIDEEHTPLHQIVQEEEALFCSKACKAARDQGIQDVNDRFEAFKEKVQALRPDLTFTSFRGGWPMTNMSAAFSFPGMQHNASVHEDKGQLTWWISGEDQDAWDQYEA